MHKWLFVLLWLINVSTVFAQNDKKLLIQGTLRDSTNDKVIAKEYFNVDINGKLISLRTDGQGKFVSNVSSDHFTQFEFRVNGYQYKRIKPSRLKSDTLDFKFINLSPKVTALKEVVIKATKRYRDTVRIDFSKEKFERFTMVNEIFAGKSGFSSSNGTLYYNGKIVSDISVNGGEFFGKKNLDVYKTLPALVIGNIEITETNIDSLTNATVLNPIIKVDLKLKEKYRSAVFGDLSAGVGTSDRYLGYAELFKYNGNEQISLAANANNINLVDNTLLDRNVSFTANGSDSKTNFLDLSYRNFIRKKIEFRFSAKGVMQNRTSDLKTERRDELIDQVSSTSVVSNFKQFDIQRAGAIINYKINESSNLSYSQNFTYNDNRQIDSSQYLIDANNTQSLSILNKNRATYGYALTGDLKYQKQFISAKGRFIGLGIGYNSERNTVNENSRVFALLGQGMDTYYVQGKRQLSTLGFAGNIDYHHPVLEDGSLQFSAAFKTERLNFTTNLDSDTIKISNEFPTNILNNIYKSGIKFYKIFNVITIDALISGSFNSRVVKEFIATREYHFAHPVIDVKANYKINKKNDFVVNVGVAPVYPEVNQLTGIGNSFDLISQRQGNAGIKPELKSSFNIAYNARKSDSLNLSISGFVEHYSAKFGDNVIIKPNTYQIGFVDNIGNSISSQLSVTWNKTFKTIGAYSYTTKVGYEELPVIVNQQRYSNKNKYIGQSITTSFTIIKKYVYIAPNLNITFNNYTYQNGGSKILTIIYSDKFSFSFKSLQLNLYPVSNFNYNAGINKSFTWALNSDVNMNILKKRGTIWLRGYDIFNSFKYYSNYVGANYVQTAKFAGLNRYIIVGLILKVNNIN
ncbi:outer membrane beta-barrel protein [Mucilaginibacter sp. ZT4R22]|uniref:Outer membrane beta-barrel protein n=1 Tax=Mucilaginibacter pankratovii TaxID=2772110 RepID=A0ABR7WR01_9SPHI|nr:outer membrane beta-barrel protein [Mucilaginibacter pankratovii]MBD1364751.1 outer membrane beta-barrel protein [Mucilaginibacter pankratovii]